MEKSGPAQELSSISGLFISGQKENQATLSCVSGQRGVAHGSPEQDCEVEETVTVRKRIAFPGERNGQENIRKSLSEYLQTGYSISRIELKKTYETLRPGHRTVTNEEIALYLK